jgi:hypothetical protein
LDPKIKSAGGVKISANDFFEKNVAQDQQKQRKK